MNQVTLRPRVTAPPVLVARIDRRTVAMDVCGVSIDVRVAGLASETTMEITFANPHPRDLEGEILFPLPEGAALCGYGLDVGGEIVEASLLAKRRAREIFDAEVRKDVDPGLMEHVAGNLFRTKVWPLPAKGRRTVRVTWVAALAFDGDTAVYELPLRFATPKKDVSTDQAAGFPSWNRLFEPVADADREGFRLRVDVAKSEVVPALSGDLGFTEHADGWRAETTRAEGVPDLVRVALPAVPARVAVVERDGDGARYFRIEDLPEAAAPTEPPVPPERIGVVWDASLSRATEDLGSDFEALRALLRGWGSVEVRLLVLRDVVEHAGDFSVVAGDAEDLLEVLRGLEMDGGTAPLPSLDDCCDLYLLFSDGLTTFGEPDLPVAGKPVYALSSAPVANHRVLRSFAESSGGAFFDLRRGDPAEVAAGIGADRLTFLGVEVTAGEVEDVTPSRPTPVALGRFGVSGRLVSTDAEVVLLYGRGGEVTERRPYTLSGADAGASRLVARIFGQARADELSVRPDRNAEALLALGRQFGIVTPNSSLLVLETLEQHLEHDVEPAPSRTELHAKWRQHRRKVQERESTRLRRKLETVRGWWSERVEWWEKKYEAKPPSVKSSAEGPGDMTFAEGDMSLSDMEMASAPPPASSPRFLARMRSPSPPPPMSAAEAEDPGGPGSGEKGVAVRGWDPDTPYLRALRKAGDDRAYEAYLRLRPDFASSPSFFLDCANHFYAMGKGDIARRVLSNVVELDLDSPALLRICAYKLSTEGDHAAAAELLERVLALRPDEPQSFRDLALVLELTGSFRRAAELLWKVVTGDWDGRFPKIETIALIELAHVIERARAEGAWIDTDALGIEGRLVRLLDADLRVVLSWDADNTDVDLWVIEPHGEKCFYQNRLTTIGGRLSDDFTGGYGPEEYMVRRALRGEYAIKANFYSSSQQDLVGPATILATIYTDYGRPEETRRVVTVRVEEVKDVLDIGEATVG